MKERIDALHQLVKENKQTVIFRDSTPGVLDLCFIVERIMHFGIRGL